jgi:hypothetical protein
MAACLPGDAAESSSASRLSMAAARESTTMEHKRGRPSNAKPKLATLLHNAERAKVAVEFTRIRCPSRQAAMAAIQPGLWRLQAAMAAIRWALWPP